MVLDSLSKTQKLGMVGILATVALVAVIVPLVMLGGGEGPPNSPPGTRTTPSPADSVKHSLQAVKDDLGSLHDQLKIKVNSNSSNNRNQHTDSASSTTAFTAASSTTARIKMRRKRDTLPIAQTNVAAVGVVPEAAAVAAPAVVPVDPALSFLPASAAVAGNAAVVQAAAVPAAGVQVIPPLAASSAAVAPSAAIAAPAPAAGVQVIPPAVAPAAVTAAPLSGATLSSTNLTSSGGGLNTAIAPAVPNLTFVREPQSAGVVILPETNITALSKEPLNGTKNTLTSTASSSKNEFLTIVNEISKALDYLEAVDQNFTREVESLLSIETKLCRKNAKEVASVRETLLNLTSRLGLVDIFSAADRQLAMDLLARIHAAEDDVDRTLQVIQNITSTTAKPRFFTEPFLLDGDRKAVEKLDKVVKYLTNITIALNGLLNITSNSTNTTTNSLLVSTTGNSTVLNVTAAGNSTSSTAVGAAANLTAGVASSSAGTVLSPPVAAVAPVVGTVSAPLPAAAGVQVLAPAAGGTVAAPMPAAGVQVLPTAVGGAMPAPLPAAGAGTVAAPPPAAGAGIVVAPPVAGVQVLPAAARVMEEPLPQPQLQVAPAPSVPAAQAPVASIPAAMPAAVPPPAAAVAVASSSAAVLPGPGLPAATVAGQNISAAGALLSSVATGVANTTSNATATAAINQTRVVRGRSEKVRLHSMAPELKLYLNHSQNVANRINTLLGLVDGDTMSDINKLKVELESAVNMINNAVIKDDLDRKYGEELVEEARTTSTSVATALLTIKNKPVVKGRRR